MMRETAFKAILGETCLETLFIIGMSIQTWEKLTKVTWCL